MVHEQRLNVGYSSGYVSTCSWFCIEMFVVLYRHIRGFVSRCSWFCIEMFVVLHRDIRGFVSRFSWFCIDIFVVLYRDIPSRLSPNPVGFFPEDNQKTCSEIVYHLECWLAIDCYLLNNKTIFIVTFNITNPNFAKTSNKSYL